MRRDLGVAVGAAVRSELARQRHSQDWLADKLGVSQANVSRRLLGKTPFDVNELAVVADVLEVGLTDLFPIEQVTAA